MTNKKQEQQSQLLTVLRESIGVVQMIMFKELRELFADKYPQRDIAERSKLAGAIINTIFGLENPEEKFQQFNVQNKTVIEHELVGFAAQFKELLPFITDALRVQTLCDSQEGEDSTAVLKQAESWQILLVDRDVPLPSVFMTRVRGLGEKHGLTIAPVQVSPEDDALLH